MHNYDHEIARPENRSIHKFLWCDYFHDSEILSAQLEGDKKKCVVMKLRCDRDERAEWRKFNDDYEKWRAYVEENAEKYVYILRFTHVVWFERKQTDCWHCSEYLNARFKDTALLRRLQEKSGKRLYHLRIQTSDGLIDLIFSGFEIRRLHGRVNYSMNVILDPPTLNDFELEMAAEEEYRKLPEDDFDRYLLLERMYHSGNPAALQIARDCMNPSFPCEEAKPYAAHLLGKIGDRTDIPQMMELYFELEKELLKTGFDYKTVALHRRNIMDAIEMIRYRAEGEAESV